MKEEGRGNCFKVEEASQISCPEPTMAQAGLESAPVRRLITNAAEHNGGRRCSTGCVWEFGVDKPRRMCRRWSLGADPALVATEVKKARGPSETAIRGRTEGIEGRTRRQRGPAAILGGGSTLGAPQQSPTSSTRAYGPDARHEIQPNVEDRPAADAGQRADH